MKFFTIWEFCMYRKRNRCVTYVWHGRYPGGISIHDKPFAVCLVWCSRWPGCVVLIPAVSVEVVELKREVWWPRWTVVPVELQLVQNLEPDDPTNRLTFCEDLITMFGEESLPERIIFSFIRSPKISMAGASTEFPCSDDYVCVCSTSSPSTSRFH